MSRVLVTGAAGMVGRETVALLTPAHDVVGLAHAQLDVTDRAAVRAIVDAQRPDVIVHAGAWTDVDGCELQPDRAYRVNAFGTRNVAEAAADRGVPVLYVSTDYVFPGDRADRPYDEFDAVGPRSHYGRSKLEGERFVRDLSGGRFWILRTQWVFGFHGKNFVDTILAAARARRPLRVVNDQIGSPTFARDVARAIYTLVTKDPGFGVYHGSNNGHCSWFEFTGEILRVAGVRPVSLDPIPSSELGRPAPRPAHAVLRNYAFELTVGDPMRAWQDGLAEYLRETGDAAGSPEDARTA